MIGHFPVRPEPPASPIDLGERRVISVRLPDPPIGHVSRELIAALLCGVGVGLACAVAFSIPDFFSDREARPWLAGCAGLVAAICTAVLVLRVRDGERASRVELDRLVSKAPPVPTEEAARAALAAARLNTLPGMTFDSLLYLRGAGPAAPRVLCIDFDLPLVPEPQMPGEVTTLPLIGSRIFNRLWLTMAIFAVQTLVMLWLALRPRPEGTSSLPALLGAGGMALALVGAVYGYSKLRQPRFIAPGALTDDSGSEHLFATRDDCVLVLRRTKPPLAGTTVTIHQSNTLETKLHFTSEARLIDFLGRWLMPLTPGSAPTPRPAQAELSPADPAEHPVPTHTESAP